MEKHKFGVLHIHDLQATMKKKGVDFPHACQVLEVCNPHHAARILDGEPQGKEGQAVAWVPVTELASYPTPPADAELVRRLVGGENP